MSTNAFDVDDVTAQADLAAQTMVEPDRSYLKVIRARFLHAMATHNIEDAVSLAFEIGKIGGHDTERSRANGRNMRRVSKASLGRTKITTKKLKLLLTFCTKFGWQIDDLDTEKKKWLAKALGVTVHRVNTYLQKLDQDAS